MQTKNNKLIFIECTIETMKGCNLEDHMEFASWLSNQCALMRFLVLCVTEKEFRKWYKVFRNFIDIDLMKILSTKELVIECEEKYRKEVK